MSLKIESIDLFADNIFTVPDREKFYNIKHDRGEFLLYNISLLTKLTAFAICQSASIKNNVEILLKIKNQMEDCLCKNPDHINDIYDYSGYSLIVFALQHTKSTPYELEIIKLLLDCPIINLSFRKECTIFEVALYNDQCNKQVMQLLLDKCSNPNSSWVTGAGLSPWRGNPSEYPLHVVNRSYRNMSDIFMEKITMLFNAGFVLDKYEHYYDKIMVANFFEEYHTYCKKKYNDLLAQNKRLKIENDLLAESFKSLSNGELIFESTANFNIICDSKKFDMLEEQNEQLIKENDFLRITIELSPGNVTVNNIAVHYYELMLIRAQSKKFSTGESKPTKPNN
jgi:hypothetical protein